ncbi:uncharacterized protein LOC110733237 [Chenopodium quinoa]|uniref:uncharacterized protein LOC110733237 n=1 Tax=Chenopodium quinoa TaxID=63459 RepID=UPI000B797F3B|nr:uncharacterized protein LOC110733237 [Chenopodium quinoa]
MHAQMQTFGQQMQEIRSHNKMVNSQLAQLTERAPFNSPSTLSGQPQPNPSHNSKPDTCKAITGSGTSYEGPNEGDSEEKKGGQESVNENKGGEKEKFDEIEGGSEKNKLDNEKTTSIPSEARNLDGPVPFPGRLAERKLNDKCLYLMADDHDPRLVEDIDDDEYEDEYEDDDSDDSDAPYDVNKEDDLGEPEDQAQDEFERRLDDFEMSAERAPAIENTAREIVGENLTPESQGQGQDENNTGGGGGEIAPAERKTRGPTRSFKKLDGPMVLEYDNKGQPGPKWRRQYANQVGLCSRKIPITLVMRQVPPGLIQAFWDDTRRQFSIPNDPEKKRVFVSLLGERFRGFKTKLTNRWIHKKKKVQTKKKNAKEDNRLPWQIWPTVSKDDWEEFVRMKSQKRAIVSLCKSDVN